MPVLPLALLGGLVIVAGLVLATPRYRSFYFGAGTRAWPPAPAEVGRTLTSRAVSAARAVAEAPPRPETFGLPLPIHGGPTGGTPAPAEPPPVHRGSVRVPGPDGQGRIVVPVSDAPPARLPAAGVPAGWDLQEFAGHAAVQVVRDEGHLALDLQSDQSSFALYRDVVLDLREYPILRWAWKAVRLPAGADARQRATDDEVAQVYIVIPRWPFPRTHSDVVGYLWDTRTPAGTAVTNPQAANVRSIVIESGYDRLGFWVREERDVHQDYVGLFGREPARVGKIAVMTDSNDTRSQSEALIDDLVFFRRPARKAGIGCIYAKMPHMLRKRA